MEKSGNQQSEWPGYNHLVIKHYKGTKCQVWERPTLGLGHITGQAGATTLVSAGCPWATTAFLVCLGISFRLEQSRRTVRWGVGNGRASGGRRNPDKTGDIWSLDIGKFYIIDEYAHETTEGTYQVLILCITSNNYTNKHRAKPERARLGCVRRQADGRSSVQQ